jgi:hypothetical protein
LPPASAGGKGGILSQEQSRLQPGFSIRFSKGGDKGKAEACREAMLKRAETIKRRWQESLRHSFRKTLWLTTRFRRGKRQTERFLRSISQLARVLRHLK